MKTIFAVSLALLAHLNLAAADVRIVTTPEAEFRRALDAYSVEFLQRNPTVNTYLGGSKLSHLLGNVDGRLREISPRAFADEDAFLEKSERTLAKFPAAQLSAGSRIDREIALAQIQFQLHLHKVRKYPQRALDTYLDDPFRAVDFQLLALSQTGPETYGKPEEWELLDRRLTEVPRFLQEAREQLLTGVRAGNTPDPRMIRRNGLESSAASAEYFGKTLPDTAAKRVGKGRDEFLKTFREHCATAAQAYADFRKFILATYFEDAEGKTLKSAFRADRFALGEKEYNWALKHNLKIDKSAATLYRESWPIVEATRKQMVELAREIAKTRRLALPAEDGPTVRAVFDELSKEHPTSDTQMIEGYRKKGVELVEYARRTGLFDVPADYRLEVMETPPPLQSSVDGASYYPAPPFLDRGVGHFYVSPTHNDPEQLKAIALASYADLAAHEGFPGHDWHYKVMTEHRAGIPAIRWLTPGAIEDSSSMWEDSMSAEGWGLYSEALLGEPQPGAPHGLYTPEEHLYQLQGKLYRDLRVRIDTGIHTKRMTYAEATRLFSEVVDFLPGDCAEAALAKASPEKRESCRGAEKAIFRYSKWPTQAITYRLGRDEIFALRAQAAQRLGAKFSAKKFHVEFMKQGTIPSGYFRKELLNQLEREANQAITKSPSHSAIAPGVGPEGPPPPPRPPSPSRPRT